MGITHMVLKHHGVELEFDVLGCLVAFGVYQL